MHVPDWLLQVKNHIREWLLSLQDPEHPGRFRWCKEGALIAPSAHTGLGAACLALKLAHQVDCLSQVSNDDLHQWIDYILSFQIRPSRRNPGFFEDRVLTRHADRKYWWLKRDTAVRRAETRQACAALLRAGARPRYPVTGIPKTPAEMSRFLTGLPWDTDPWHAGSHAGHMVFFLKFNADCFGMTAAYDELAPVVLDMLDSLQNPDSGAWFLGNPPVHNIVNGAMKVLTLYEFIRKPFPRPEKLIDFCLTVANDGDACNNADVIYVLHECSRWTSHRQQDVQAAAARKLAILQTHAIPGQAFSFFPGRSGMYYYGLHVSRGLPESDIQGSVLIAWTCTLIAGLLGFREELGWNLPIT